MISNYTIEKHLSDLEKCFRTFQEDNGDVKIIKILDFLKNKGSKGLLRIFEELSKNYNTIDFNEFLDYFYYFSADQGFIDYLKEYFKINSKDMIMDKSNFMCAMKILPKEKIDNANLNEIFSRNSPITEDKFLSIILNF